MGFPEPEVPKGKSEISPSRVFELFRKDYSPMEVVEETDGDPIKIRDWYRAWLDMRNDWAKAKGEKLDREARETISELKELLGADAFRLQGKKPSGLVAAMFCILAEEEGLSVRKARIAEDYGITDAVLRGNIRLLQQLMKEKGLKLTVRHFVVVSEKEAEKDV